MTGPEVSIDTLVFGGEAHLVTIADRHIEFPPYFVETGHTLPSNLPESIQQEVFGVMEKGIKALGITLGASKGDIKITPDGPKIGEMTARMSGGFHCQYTDPLATGMNSIKAAVHLAIGEPVDMNDLTPKWRRTAVESGRYLQSQGSFVRYRESTRRWTSPASSTSSSTSPKVT